MKKISYLMFFSLSLLSMEVLAQEKQEILTKEKILAEADVKNVYIKKFRFGLSWNQYWGTIKGSNLPKTYFTKPSIGFNIRAEYYPLSFVGIGAGVGVQQRGAGIINKDNYGTPFTHPWDTPYDRDSTYRERLRFNTFEVPVTLLLRTPKDVIKGVRLSAAAGLVFVKVNWVNNIFLSPEDGFHIITVESENYIKKDLAYQLSFGTDINAGESCVLQVHFVYTNGTKNIYINDPGDGRLKTFGFRVAWLF